MSEHDLPDDVLIEVAQWLFAAEWADVREAAGFTFAPGTELTEVAPKQDPAKLLELIRPYLTRLRRNWDITTGKMFALMEIPKDEWARALYLVLMSCRGHGIGLADDFDTNITIAGRKLRRSIDPSPFSDEMLPFFMLADDVVEAWARTPDDDPDPDAPLQPGDRVRITDARMPTGETLSGTGTGTVVRWYPAWQRSRAEDGMIVTIDEGADSSYAGRTACVDADDCELIEG